MNHELFIFLLAWYKSSECCVFRSNTMEAKDKKDDTTKIPVQLRDVIEKTIQSAYNKDWCKTRTGRIWHTRHINKTW
ncbi:hypothetical protein [Erinnyis ello granulovirus]|uniref:Uncharacterized protein n=1 Tax=Erinnyis ello granulovirus TaxID=307444 RepID=A0A097DAT7_9BBAC|nr:hypothetical protein [Erinnyis ello granulovirus]AIS92113.1 hypothetical protein [Erinnyis ello granulovirus]ARX71454.1 hypothetical protein EREL_115 [Erinnyis ello granulovirus]ARX71584.1 hypothetical protein EREL_115 [Erinnyis ello granulovirus]ARX71714.1 hypothetical protein EREL_115 [Erinnyis ello granulovirus]ARX71844.1 hypothetical protein EREL_115 [Erinnyis ello granulovirus]